MPEHNGVNLSQVMLENVTDIDSFLLTFLIDFSAISAIPVMKRC